jgi:membrane protease YdiL (CAAX protease family)
MGRTLVPARLIRRYPLPSFFALAYLLSWLAWLPYVLGRDGLELLPFHVPGGQLLGVLPGGYLGPITSALVVTAVTGGRTGLRRWGRRLVRWGVAWWWYPVVILGVPVALVVATFVLPGAWGHLRTPSTAVLAGYLPLLVLQVLTTGVAEEPGWRDFALPRLQGRYGPLVGTLVLGPLWGAWHLPLFLTAWAGPHVSWVMPVEFMVTAVALSIVMTWLFNRTGESLPLVMVFHASLNTVFSSAWPWMFPTLDPDADSLHALLAVSALLAAVLLVATRGRLGAPRR